jgi:hypothetical protein
MDMEVVEGKDQVIEGGLVVSTVVVEEWVVRVMMEDSMEGWEDLMEQEVLMEVEKVREVWEQVGVEIEDLNHMAMTVMVELLVKEENSVVIREVEENLAGNQGVGV